MNKRTLKIAGWGVLILAIIGVLGLTVVYIRAIDSTQPTPVDSAILEQQSEQDIAETLETLIESEEDQTNPSEQTAVLDSLRNNGNEFGVAARTYDAPTNFFTIELIATIGDPQPGNSYVSSVTDGTRTVELGTLVKDIENTYTLSYSGNDNITGLDEMIVTEVGDSPEDVMQGTFE